MLDELIQILEPLILKNRTSNGLSVLRMEECTHRQLVMTLGYVSPVVWLLLSNSPAFSSNFLHHAQLSGPVSPKDKCETNYGYPWPKRISHLASPVATSSVCRIPKSSLLCIPHVVSNWWWSILSFFFFPFCVLTVMTTYAHVWSSKIHRVRRYTRTGLALVCGPQIGFTFLPLCLINTSDDFRSRHGTFLFASTSPTNKKNNSKYC
jgi:hypothetical protein